MLIDLLFSLFSVIHVSSLEGSSAQQTDDAVGRSPSTRPKGIALNEAFSTDTVEEIDPHRQSAYSGSVSKDTGTLYKFTTDPETDSFIDVVVQLDESDLPFDSALHLFVRITNDPNTLGQADENPLHRQVTGADIYGALLTAAQESALCMNCRRAQISAKHTVRGNSTYWISVDSEWTLDATPHSIRYTLHVIVRPRKAFVWLHSAVLLVIGLLAASLLLPTLYSFLRAPRAVYPMWGHIYFEELMTVPFLFLRSAIGLGRSTWKRSRDWRNVFGKNGKGTSREALMDSLDTVECGEEDFNAPSCRICRDVTGPLIAPCKCTGSMAFVHRECLDRWRTECFKNNPSSKKISSCEVCLEPFDESLQYKRGDLLNRFMHAQLEGLRIAIGQFSSFWAFLFMWSLITKYGLTRLACVAPWHTPRDLSVWSVDAFLQSFFLYSAYFGMFYLSAYFLFLSRHGEGRLYSVRSVLFAGLVLGTCCYASWLMKFLVYLSSDTFVWDYEVKLIPGVLLLLIVGAFASVFIGFVSRARGERRYSVVERERV